jgi:hypothetical protein
MSGASQAFHYGLPFHVGIRLMEPPGPYSQQQQTQSDSICFTAIFVNNVALCYSPYCMLYIVYKLENEFLMPKALALLHICILYSIAYYIIFSFVTAQKTIFINYITINLI